MNKILKKNIFLLRLYNTIGIIILENRNFLEKRTTKIMILIIAEKPDMMRKIAKALDGSAAKTDGKGKMASSNYTYSHAVGHVLQLASPADIDKKYEKWTLESLPMYFSRIPLQKVPSTSEQLTVLKKLLANKTFDEVVNACDADREGELIFREIVEYCGCKAKKVTRMWITSATDEGIREAFEERKASKLYDNLAKAAQGRSYADFMVGLNATRAMTVKYGGHKNVLSVGRVQTPTLRIIVDLEKEIRNFKSSKYYKLKANVLTKDGMTFVASYHDENLDDDKFKTLDEATRRAKEIGTGPATINVNKVEDKQEKPKMLFNLSDLQIEMSAKYGMTADKVLSLAQALYEQHALITYPRTDENHISQEMADKTYNIVKNIPVFKEYTSEIIKNGWKINPMMVVKTNGAIGAHEALTPVVGRISEFEIAKLNPDEKKVFDAIYKRFLAAFYPNAVYKTQHVELERNDGTFVANSKTLVKPGWKAVYGTDDNEEEKEEEGTTLIPVKENDKVNIDSIEPTEQETKAPQRFTEGSLIKMMKNPVKYVDSKDEKEVLKKTHGIGTEATRAAIIETLKKREFIEIKNKKIYATEKGISFIDIIPSEIVKSVSLTAQFEAKLAAMKEGEYGYDKFMQEIKELDEEFIAEVKKAKEEVKVYNKEQGEEICKCPRCGGTIRETKWGYKCDSCDVNVRKEALPAKFKFKGVTKAQAVELLAKGKTKKTVSLYSEKSGKKFDAYLTYTYKEGEQYPNNVWIAFE